MRARAARPVGRGPSGRRSSGLRGRTRRHAGPAPCRGGQVAPASPSSSGVRSGTVRSCRLILRCQGSSVSNAPPAKPSRAYQARRPRFERPGRASRGVPGRAAGAGLGARPAGGRGCAGGRGAGPGPLPRSARPALQEVGHRWAMGALNVAEEHYATAIAQSILDGLSRQLPRAAARRAAGRGHRDAGGAARARRADGGRLPRGRRLGGAAARRGRAGATTSWRWSTTSSRTWWRSRPRPRACWTAWSRSWARCAAARRARASSPAASCWTRDDGPTALELGADLVVHDPRELVAELHERIPPPEADGEHPPRPARGRRRRPRAVRRGGRMAGRAGPARPVGNGAVLAFPARSNERAWARAAALRRRGRRRTSRSGSSCSAPTRSGSSRRIGPKLYIDALVTSRATPG